MKDATRIVIILDRSGSMLNCKEATIAGFNKFIDDQKQIPGECSVRLIQFDHQYTCVFDSPLAKVPKLTTETFIPRGNTALLDAMGRTIDELGNELHRLPESERPDKILVVTITDGEENASYQYVLTKADNLNRTHPCPVVSDMITHQQDKYKWNFVYLGANQDAIKVATSMGMCAGSTMTYSTNPIAVNSTYSSMSNYTKAVRGGQRNVNFSTQDRKAAVADDTSTDTTTPKKN